MAGRPFVHIRSFQWPFLWHLFVLGEQDGEGELDPEEREPAAEDQDGLQQGRLYQPFPRRFACCYSHWNNIGSLI